jgi:hypothetical protein
VVDVVTDRLVHFIYLGGEFLWQHWRAVETAKVHDAPIVMWCAAKGSGEYWDAVDCAKHTLVYDPELLEHPIQLANVKDFFAWSMLLWGTLDRTPGLYLHLDTISLQPCWDLLTRDVCVSSEHERGFDAGHPYNSAVVLGRGGAPVLSELRRRSREVLESGESRWGKCGPHLLTDVVAEHPDAFDVAPFGVLNGWRDDTIHRYYEGERPGPDVRVVHLFSSSRMDSFRADRWMP